MGSLNWKTYGWPKSTNGELKININSYGWAVKIFCGKTFRATMDNYLEEKTLSIIIWKIIARIHLRILFLSKLLLFSCDIHEISASYQEWFHCQIPWMAIARNSQHPHLFILIVIENELHDFLFWSFRK